MARVSVPFVPALLAACHLARGHRLLDVGTGDRLGRSGSRDRRGCLGGGARRRARDAGARQAPGRPLGAHLVAGDAEALPCRDASFDAATCHFALVFIDWPETALMELRRVLRPGGRVALTALIRPAAPVYGPVFAALGQHVARPREMLRQLCALGTPDRLPALLAGAGFREPRVERVCHEVRWASFAEYWSVIDAGGGLAGQEYGALPEAARRAVRADVERAVAGRQDATGLAWELEALLGTAPALSHAAASRPSKRFRHRA